MSQATKASYIQISSTLGLHLQCVFFRHSSVSNQKSLINETSFTGVTGCRPRMVEVVTVSVAADATLCPYSMRTAQEGWHG